MKRILTVCLLLMLAWAALIHPDPARAASADDVAKALKENPQLVFEALKQDKSQLLDILDAAIAEREAKERMQRFNANLSNPLKPELDEKRPFLGDAKAPVTIVEYSDFLCSYCGRGSQAVTELMRRHPGKIRVFFKHFPNKPGSIEPALMFEALGKQNRELAWRFAELAFASQASLADGSGKGVAALVGSLGGDYAKLKKEAGSKEILARIEADVREAKTFGVDGTPTFLVNGILVRGAVPVEEFERVMGLVEKR